MNEVDPVVDTISAYGNRPAHGALHREVAGTTHEELESLYAQLGRTLYEQTKDDEKAYLRCPALYLAIARALKDIEG